jgi:hypothetical protein
MPLEAEFASNCVGWVAGGVSAAIQVARSEPRGIKERPVELHLFDLESGRVA